ncbi:MAG: hypothetical protein GY738_10290 [Pseudoalteromonas sp.]|nr:hypothetical protein [Pseudoalteromonas sp.]
MPVEPLTQPLSQMTQLTLSPNIDIFKEDDDDSSIIAQRGSPIPSPNINISNDLLDDFLHDSDESNDPRNERDGMLYILFIVRNL